MLFNAPAMTKTKRQQTAPLDALHRHFSDPTRYGERWKLTLYPALIQPTRYTSLYNRYAIESDFSKAVGSPDSLSKLELPLSEGQQNLEPLACFIRPALEDGKPNPTAFPQPGRSSNGMATHWNLDAASLLAVQILGIVKGDRVLDLCAAPGGKSVALAQSIWPDMKPGRPSAMPLEGCIHSNEADRTRHKRLDTNLRMYLPVLCISSGRVKALNLDGTHGAQLLPLGVGGYDKVLLDAPCSSERHVLQAQERLSHISPPRTADEMARWSPSVSKRMAETQLQLLSTAVRALKVGGRLLYATCSISHEENDDVVEKALKYFVNEQRKGGVRWTVALAEIDAKLISGLESWAEKTTYGWLVLPDHVSPYGVGWGPLYFAILSKQIATT